jgi:hypothetical protein
MLTALRQGRVDGLRVSVACARSLDEMPYDVYLLDLVTPSQTVPGGGRFDEVPYLEYLEPVLDAAGGPPSWVVEVTRTHGSDHDGVGQAHLSVLLVVGKAPSAPGSDPDLTAVVRSAFTQMAQPTAAQPTRAAQEARETAGGLTHGQALTAATDAIAHSFPGIDPQALSLTDEEHHAAEGRWSLGLALPEVARFQVQLGLVPGALASAHVRRMPVGEVVDSVGT